MYTIATEILKSDKDNTIQRVSCQKINNIVMKFTVLLHMPSKPTPDLLQELTRTIMNNKK